MQTHDILACILPFLNIVDLANFFSCCKAWHSMSKYEYVWQMLLESHKLQPEKKQRKNTKPEKQLQGDKIRQVFIKIVVGKNSTQNKSILKKIFAQSRSSTLEKVCSGIASLDTKIFTQTGCKLIPPLLEYCRFRTGNEQMLIDTIEFIASHENPEHHLTREANMMNVLVYMGMATFEALVPLYMKQLAQHPGTPAEFPLLWLHNYQIGEQYRINAFRVMMKSGMCNPALYGLPKTTDVILDSIDKKPSFCDAIERMGYLYMLPEFAKYVSKPIVLDATILSVSSASCHYILDYPVINANVVVPNRQPLIELLALSNGSSTVTRIKIINYLVQQGATLSGIAFYINFWIDAPFRRSLNFDPVRCNMRLLFNSSCLISYAPCAHLLMLHIINKYLKKHARRDTPTSQKP